MFGPSRRALLTMCAVALVGSAALVAPPARAASGQDDPVAREAVERMAAFFADEAAVAGGYVYAYTPDLSVRRGEGGKVEADVGWNQPPGTPGVGAAFLLLHETTGDERWLDAARAAAHAVVEGQLASGGWFNFTRTDPAARATWCYRSDGTTGEACKTIEGHRERNLSSLDDNITQSALGFLLWYNKATDGSDAVAAEALTYGMSRLLAAQYPNGGWGPFFEKAAAREGFDAAPRASMPESWSREYIVPNEPPYFVVNDHLIRDVIRLLLNAEEVTGDKTFLDAAVRSGDFLLAAQLPEPQQGWAQTYNIDLEPVWGRWFEPPSVASGETAGVIDGLIDLYIRTDDQRYLDGATKAAEWLRKTRRADGRWSRFYELETDKPLYVTADGAVAYDTKALRTGYTFEGYFGIETVLARLDRVLAGTETEREIGLDAVFEPIEHVKDPKAFLQDVGARTDDSGRLVEDGWIRSDTFVNAVRALAHTKRSAD